MKEQDSLDEQIETIGMVTTHPGLEGVRVYAKEDIKRLILAQQRKAVVEARLELIELLLTMCEVKFSPDMETRYEHLVSELLLQKDQLKLQEGSE